ncbi:helix-turn-helix domain-containing protein [Pseudomethylobacillus aquaticus]|uniref:Helix-turn-helix domain-containing protein n=1 Tax=Pseudomethylobacillus aquaticus TaxID=2676064 RepID=A0A3N0UY01_9PROT|nr:RodZ domain-containing protein [Pseudomethylobacillus aquaticus]ROH85439.1 helix-turn-helix domain-containing protein [Pseudomethylobacillus aquaticus]
MQTDQSVIPPEGAVSGASSTPRLGETLIAAREAMQLKVEDVSARLRLSVQQVRALESEEFSALPDPMITRGFIRNYARLLQIDAEPLIEIHRQLAPAATLRPLTLLSENIPMQSPRRRSWLVYAVVIVVLLAIAGVWHSLNRPLAVDLTPEAPAPESVPLPPAPASELPPGGELSAVVPEVTNAAPAAEPSSVEAAPATEPSTVTEATPAEPAVVTPAPATTTSTSTTATGATARVEFSFSENSWVGVRDADGKEIFNKSKAAGKTDFVEGKPPFSIVIGNASGTSLTFNGKPVDLAPHTSLNVARLTLGAP